MLIRNAHIVNAFDEKQADILIRGRRIAKIGKNLPTEDMDVSAVIDASGMLVFPGGIDPHVHMHLPTAAGFSSDDFVSGSRAALMGGTTTMIDFVTPRRGMSLTEALRLRIDEAAGCLIDHSFHVSPVEWTPDTALQIRQCIAAGFPSFKLYMAYKDAIGIDDGVMEKVMQTLADAGGMATAHCETGDEVDRLRDSLFASGHPEPSSHPLSRPPHAESDAVAKAIAIAEKTASPLYIVHVSSAGSIEHIRKAKEKGLPVMAEVCPHHLLLDESSYKASFEDAAPFVMSPPLRSEPHRKALWDALQTGIIDATGTDHCPFLMSQKEHGRADFRKIANGAGGVEHRLSLLYTFGVRAGIISLQQFVEVCSSGAAKIFGLYPQKGLIAEGSDADLVIWDPNAEETISVKTHHQNSDMNIYEGIRVYGKPVFVIAGGKTAVSHGCLNEGLRGELLRRPLIQ
ncbi:MAG: dihydropyrimidinase [Bacteroidia bacterium]|nr:MAG: dihydropyrimidinase [Bacteroidia bacterium]